MKNILITRGAGFIGCHVVKLFVKKYPDYNIINLDKLTYAGNLENLTDIENYSNYTFVRGDICDIEKVKEVFEKYTIDSVIHLAAESHVDRSISNPFEFAQTNILGTLTLLNQAKNSWQNNFKGKLFYHSSTDEVYGSLGNNGLFLEDTPYDPKSPYSAAKASSDHFVRAYHNTLKLPVVITNCSNNYGPNQYQEKLITYVKDRTRHDMRYSLDLTKISIELAWKHSLLFEEGFKRTNIFPERHLIDNIFNNTELFDYNNQLYK